MGSPLIVFATAYFGRSALEHVPADVKPCFSDDRSRLREADAVVFHIPDFTYRRFGDTPKYPGQLWVAWSMESDANYPLQVDPRFRRPFDLTIGYKRSADIWTAYLPALEDWLNAQQFVQAPRQSAVPAVMFQSAPHNRSHRIEFATELMRHVRVDSYGRVLHNCDLDEADRGTPTKMRVIGQYCFCLAFENSISPDYVTEKLFQPLMAGTVPIYLGAANAHEFAPPHSFIRADGFGGAKGLAAYLHHLMTHPDEYGAYLAWRHRPLPDSLVALISRRRNESVWRDLIERVAARRRQRLRAYPRFPFGYPAALRARWLKCMSRARLS